MDPLKVHLSTDEYFAIVAKLRKSDPVFIEAIDSNINAYLAPEKFLKKYSSGMDINLKKVAFEYMERVCVREAINSHERDVDRYVAIQLKCKQVVRAKTAKLIKAVFRVEMTDEVLCKIGCKIGFDCYHDFRGSEKCKSNICATCGRGTAVGARAGARRAPG